MQTNTRYNKGGEGASNKFPFEILLEKPAIDFRDEEYDILLNDLQANILQHHKKAIAEHHFIKFTDRENGVTLLENLSSFITTAKEQLEGKTEEILAIYLTFEGYNTLGISENLIPEGGAFRSAFSDRVLLDKDRVEDDYNTNFDAVILFAYDELKSVKKESGLGRFWNYMTDKHGKGDLTACCKTIVFEEGLLKNQMDKSLTFKENISNPVFFSGTEPSRKRKKMTEAIQALKTSALPNLDLVLLRDKTGNREFSCGTFGAFSKFELNEDAFESFISDLEVKAGMSKKEALAYLMGRFQDGTPRTLSDEPLNLPTNQFDYTEQLKAKYVKTTQEDNGSRCPFHAHIRKANPRTKGTEDSRIVRRGTYFKTGNVKGMLFMSFQNSLEKQFEHILNDWMLNKSFVVKNETTVSGEKTGRDMLFAKAGDEYPLPRNWNEKENSDDNAKEAKSEKIKIKEPFISFKGGLYFFVPCISFFKRIVLFNEIAKAKINRKENKQMVWSGSNSEITGAERNFLQDTIVKLGTTEIKKGEIEVVDGTQMILA